MSKLGGQGIQDRSGQWDAPPEVCRSGQGQPPRVVSRGHAQEEARRHGALRK